MLVVGRELMSSVSQQIQSIVHSHISVESLIDTDEISREVNLDLMEGIRGTLKSHLPRGPELEGVIRRWHE